MNVGYTRRWNSSINDECCPICGKDIYVSKYGNNFACIDPMCALGHGARELINNVDNLLKMLDNEKENK